MHGTQLELTDFKSYMFWEVPGCGLVDREAATARVYAFHASAHFDRIRPITGAVEVRMRRHQCITGG